MHYFTILCYISLVEIYCTIQYFTILCHLLQEAVFYTNLSQQAVSLVTIVMSVLATIVSPRPRALTTRMEEKNDDVIDWLLKPSINFTNNSVETTENHKGKLFTFSGYFFILSSSTKYCLHAQYLAFLIVRAVFSS